MQHTEVGNKSLFGGLKTARDKFGSQPVRQSISWPCRMFSVRVALLFWELCFTLEQY